MVNRSNPGIRGRMAAQVIGRSDIIIVDIPARSSFQRGIDAARGKAEFADRQRGIHEHLVPGHPHTLQGNLRLTAQKFGQRGVRNRCRVSQQMGEFPPRGPPSADRSKNIESFLER